MAEPRKYATATAFRRALEDRLKTVAGKESLPLQRLRREAAFDRLLARLFAEAGAPWVLKGGYALELRLKEARATKDIDLGLREALGAGDALLSALRAAASRDLGDYFVFEWGEATLDLDGPPYGGSRFPVTARMDERVFAEFHVDVGIGDVLLAPLETAVGRDWLGFAGITAAKCPMISKEQHFAEKVHAYTLPRTGPNTRVRDLVDMVLLIKTRTLDAGRVAEALQATVARRKTHVVPALLEPPPEAWKEAYAALAGECGLSREMGEAYSVLTGFYGELP